MDFLEFLKYIPKIEKETLPAQEAHAKMAPVERIAALENIDLKSLNPQKAAVMMLFYPKNNETYLALIKRNAYPGVHSSQIAFPGGKVEQTDKSLKETALRETHEEIGVEPGKIQVIRPFSEIYIPPSNFLVLPYMGISHSEPVFIPQEEEVVNIIEFPLKDILDENIVVIKSMDTSYGTGLSVPTFKIQEHHVWGATAMMMSELKEVLKKVI